MELEAEEEEMAMAATSWGVLLAEAVSCGELGRFKVRLKRPEDGRWIGTFTFYEEPAAKTLHLP